MELVRNYEITDALITYDYGTPTASFPLYDSASNAFIFGFTTTYFQKNQNWNAYYNNLVSTI